MIRIFLTAQKSVEKSVRELERGERNIRKFIQRALRESGAHMLRSVDQNFRVGGRPKWPALSRATLASRRTGKGVGSAKPLQDTGRLKQSISMIVREAEAVIGTNVEYARIHQEGGTLSLPEIRPRAGKVLRFVLADGTVVFAKRVRPHTVKIPQRAFLLFQSKDVRLIEKIFDNQIGQALDPGFQGGRT